MRTRRPSPLAALLLAIALAWAGPGHAAPLAATATPAGTHAGVHGGDCPCGHAHGTGLACDLGCPQCAQCHGAAGAVPAAAALGRAMPVVHAAPRPTGPVPAAPFRPPRT